MRGEAQGVESGTGAKKKVCKNSHGEAVCLLRLLCCLLARFCYGKNEEESADGTVASVASSHGGSILNSIHLSGGSNPNAPRPLLGP